VAKRVRAESAWTVLVDALDALGDAVLVLDRELRVIAATKEAERVLGFHVPARAAAAKLLCGEAPERPVAEALAEGRAVSAKIVRPGRRGEEKIIEVRATPLGREAGAQPSGFLLELGEAAVPGEEEGGAVHFFGLWTRDPGMRAVLSIVEKAARSEVTVLLRGETGTGKELLARAIHQLSPRSEGPFHAINCAALSPALLESELFGHVRGAFTGAVRDAPGHFRLASGGTLFLDEIAEMPLDLQAKLLRVIQSRAVSPVGGSESIPVDVRIVSATHRSLRAEVQAGKFRADLMYRLRVVPIFIPALRERRDDVLLLAEKTIQRLNARAMGREIRRIARPAEEALLAYGWPGNVRELENAIEYAYVIGEGPMLEVHQLPPEIAAPGTTASSPAVNKPPRIGEHQPGGAEAARIARALERASGSRTRAAQLLGMSRVTLWRKMRALGLGEAGAAATDS
jgi:transcriptional regulator with PAS, ATPase and Fis domain